MTERPPHVLVVYGSKRGGTAEIADAIVETLLNEGIDADLADAATIEDIDDYDAVVVGGAISMHRWHRDARRFINHHEDALRGRPVWLFSTGPLDASAMSHDVPPGSVAAIANRIHARDHVTFGESRAGDWRAWHRIRAWARGLVPQLHERMRLVVSSEPLNVPHWPHFPLLRAF